MALGVILVVAIAVLGSVTVLPAVLALLGDRVDRGRVLRGRPARRGGGGFWAGVADTVTGHPLAWLMGAVCVLGALAVPVLSMGTANPGETDLPANTPVLVAAHAIERAFPGAAVTAHIVLTGHRLDAPAAVAGCGGLVGGRSRSPQDAAWSGWWSLAMATPPCCQSRCLTAA